MAIKTTSEYAAEVKAMGFSKIKGNTTLFNAVSKALEKAHNKDQFHYLNDKNRDPEHLYIKYIKDNSINVSGDLKKAASVVCTGPGANPANAALVIKGIDKEVNKLFDTNLIQCLVGNVSFKVWVDSQNAPEIKKLADKNAQVAGKKLGIKDVASLSKALAAMMSDDKPTALKALEKLAKEEKLKDKAEVIMKSLAAAGLV
jgi:hypothetical protein